MTERRINSLLIANRGEIACRIIQTCHKLGIRAVAIFSEVDSHARHVTLADSAFLVEGATPVAAYLNVERIIEIAQQCGADAIHPGYGFLSENAAFANACNAVGIIFVGPPASAIAAMGSKSAAKTIMQQAGVPLIPGYHGSEQTPTALMAQASTIGFPLLIKAAFGGGGKGMRIVEQEAQFMAQLEAAKREAKAAFGDDSMLLEKYIQQPRHIEVQVFADQHGQCIYLGDRDCSLQRRHQKVIEEAPAPNLTDATRQAMGQAAVAAAQAIDYVGAGTIEFLLDAQQQFYFMEMNTRLQVEHPVTEMVTGVDLVAWQLQIAMGQPLPLTQTEVTITGHAFEARIYAEDPLHQFLPASGKLYELQPPQPSATIRIDSGVQAGDIITPYYDPMIAKLIVHQPDRQQALSSLVLALQQYVIAGVKHNIDFLRRLAAHSEFAGTHFSTHFIEQHQAELLAPAVDDKIVALAAIGCLLRNQQQQTLPQTLAGFRLNAAATWQQYLAAEEWEPAGDQTAPSWITLQQATADAYQLELGNKRFLVSGEFNAATGQLYAMLNGEVLSCHLFWQQTRLYLCHQGQTVEFQTAAPTIQQDNSAQHSFCAPMNGTIVTQLVAPGEAVKAGQGLLVMEAMKMEYQLNAPTAGSVSAFCFTAGALVSEGDLLLHFSAEDADADTYSDTDADTNITEAD
ncbi:acetyl-CoA carboxylase biotin carboxylase subunit [Shewanella avicenniae]|uniref:Acetyl-CoA carboxylase biotin carboxylase subunit n=1 Tax=Shewanella avicenniae TaxID=2814294 RepID=A0ABX7QMU4_9GAMM|nr:acetyl-CoA carboxylase biotin carboxylase subunit [Shewanella avicenniae]QSX32763.1 acetyl-CoA carboxylase biotin carboxylase subunit [Shewanella avicenniae]